MNLKSFMKEEEKKMTNALMQQVDSLKELAHAQFNTAFSNAQQVMSFTEISNIRRIYIAGLGDSYAAALGLVKLFKKYSDTYGVDVITPMHFTRFAKNNNFDKGEPNSTLMITISNGGESSRIVEIVTKAKEMKLLTMAITNNPNSRSAKLSDKVLLMELEKVPYATVGLRSYLTMLYNLFSFILHFGRVRGTISSYQEEELKNAAMQLFDEYVEKFDEFKDIAKKIANEIEDDEIIDFIGDDTSYASAYFASAKFVECLGSLISIDDSENWCHINAYLKSDRAIPTFIFANKYSTSYSREVDTAMQAVLMNRRVIVVGDVNQEDFSEKATIIALPECEKYSWIHNFYEYIPLSMIVAYLQEKKNTKDFCTGKHLKNATTKSSKIEIVL